MTGIGVKTNYRVLAGFLRGKSDRPLREKEVRTLLKLIRENIVPRRKEEEIEFQEEPREQAKESGEEIKSKVLEDEGKAMGGGREKKWKTYAFSMEQGAPRRILGSVPSFRFEL
jgi:hypothetical protein